MQAEHDPHRRADKGPEMRFSGPFCAFPQAPGKVLRPR
jgi:hypothetical protein